MLPAPDVVLETLPPRPHVRRQGLARHPERQSLVLDVRGGPADEAVGGRVEALRHVVVQAPHLRCGARVAVEIGLREVPVDVGPHLGDEVLADLPQVVAQALGVPLVPREQEHAHVLERIAAQDHRARLLHVRGPVRVHVLHAPGAPVAVGEDADDPAVGPEVEVAGRQGLGDGGEAGVPAVVLEGAEPGAAPGGVPVRREPVVGDAVGGDRRRVGVQPHRLGRLAKGLTCAEGPHRRHRVGLRARDERVGAAVARDANQVLDRRVVRLQIIVADGPVGEGVPLRQHPLAEVVAHVREVPEVVRVVAAQHAAPVDDRAADAVHHAPQGVGGLAGGLPFP